MTPWETACALHALHPSRETGRAMVRAWCAMSAEGKAAAIEKRARPFRARIPVAVEDDRDNPRILEPTDAR